MQAVKLFGRESQRGVQYQNLAVDTFNAGVRVQKLRMVFSAVNGVLFGFADIAVVWLGALLVLDGGFSVGMLFAFVSYKSQFTSRMSALIDNAIGRADVGAAHRPGRGHRARGGGTRLPVRGRRRADRTLRHRIARRQRAVRRRGAVRVARRQPDRGEGESVAIVGPSGCGKTTLLRVILGLLPAEGEVLIGGVPLSRVGPSSFRGLIGTVMQDDRLFGGSIADNIAFFDPAADQTHVEACATMAAIHEDIIAMPMGYHTLIGDMGTALSGGQKQRVLLARALYKRPKILLLDEATSHLDAPREKQVSEAIRHLKMTRLIVAHRRETIATVDRVFNLGPEESHRFKVEVRTVSRGSVIPLDPRVG